MDYSNGELLVTGENATAHIFATYPAKHLSALNGFFDQVRRKTSFDFNFLKGFFSAKEHGELLLRMYLSEVRVRVMHV